MEFWKTFGFKTGRVIHVIENKKTGNVIYAKYIDGESLTNDEIEEELF